MRWRPWSLVVALTLGTAAQTQATDWPQPLALPAFVVHTPTLLYEKVGDPPIQALKASPWPYQLGDASPVSAPDGALYYRLHSGEFIMARSPKGSVDAEDKGHLVFTSPAGHSLEATVKEQTPLFVVPLSELPYQTDHLAPGTKVRIVYGLQTPTEPMFFVEADNHSGWIRNKGLEWDTPPAPMDPPQTPPPKPQARRLANLASNPTADEAAVQHILDLYNEGVEGSQSYYRKLTGRSADARTFLLVNIARNEQIIRITLGVKQGRVPLAAETLLQRLLDQTLGAPTQIVWP